MSDRRRVILHGLVVVAGLAAAILFALRMTIAPAPVTSASEGEFSVDRALAHVKEIAQAPHPAESAENARVRNYLIEQLTRLGIKPETRMANVARRTGEAVKVKNLIARLPGISSAAGKRAIMLAAHYDSVDRGPGAGDDAAGVAALLETLRALRAGPPLDRDVFLLLTDGEELGLLGARGLFEKGEGLELLPKIAMVMNFEARGTAGPSIMFETAPHNLSFIRHFAAASPYPIGNSLSYDVYRMLPNNTDFTVFRLAGLKGLNFAMIGNYFYYHTKNDSVENLDRGSLYHHGSAALALTRHFANLNDEEMAGLLADDQPNAVYFNISTTVMVRYSSIWIWPLTALQILLTALSIVTGIKRKSISGRGLAGAGLRLGLALLLTPVAAYGLMQIFHPARTPGAFNVQLSALAGLAVIITFALALEFRRVVKPADLSVAGLVLLLLLSIPINLLVPGGSFLTLWPALFLSAGMLAANYLQPLSSARSLIGFFAALPAAMLLVPMTKLFIVALRLEAAPMLVDLFVLSAWLVIGALLPALEARERAVPK